MSNPNGQNPYPGVPAPGYGYPQGMPGQAGPPASGYGYPPQYGHGQPAPPAARGSSKALPIVVSVGLAVGVFLGLLYVRGTGKTEASASNVPTLSDAGVDTPPVLTSDAAVVAQVTADAAAVVMAPPDAAPAVPAVATRATLTFLISPTDAAITVDKEAVENDKVTLALDNGKKKVRVVATATGYRAYTKDITVTSDQLIEITLRKRSSGTTIRPGGSTGPSGRIDLKGL